LPNKPSGKKKPKPVKRWRIAIAGAYVIVLLWSAFNVASPSSAIPGLSFDYSPQSYYWTLTIPPNPPENFAGFYNETAVLNVTVSAPQPFADGIPITIYVVGCVKGSTNVTFDQFKIGFTGAYDHKNPGSIYNGYTVEAFSFVYPKPPAKWPNNCPSALGANAVHFIGETFDTTFYFENPGTYPVSVKASIWPNLFGAPTEYDYPNNAVSIQQSSTLNQGIYGKAEALAVIASSAFVVLELYPEIKKRFQ
jgi:hypothetical protein